MWIPIKRVRFALVDPIRDSIFYFDINCFASVDPFMVAEIHFHSVCYVKTGKYLMDQKILYRQIFSSLNMLSTVQKTNSYVGAFYRM